jgi:hypothetical protein
MNKIKKEKAFWVRGPLILITHCRHLGDLAPRGA